MSRIRFNQELTNILRYQPEIEAFVGVGTAARIYNVATPDAVNVYPQLKFQTISNGDMTCLTGTIGLAKRRVQIVAYAKDSTTAEDLADTVKELLLSYRGEVIADVQPAFFEMEDRDPDNPNLYFKQVDYMMTVVSAPLVKP